MHEKFNGRLEFNKFAKSTEKATADVSTGDLSLNTFGLVGDWHPTGGAFRFGLGVFANKNKIRASSADGSYEYNNQAYTGQTKQVYVLVARYQT